VLRTPQFSDVALAHCGLSMHRALVLRQTGYAAVAHSGLSIALAQSALSIQQRQPVSRSTGPGFSYRPRGEGWRWGGGSWESHEWTPANSTKPE